MGNIKYNVAVSSVTRCYETTLEDTIFLREDVSRQKRSIASNLALTDKYSAKSDVETIKSQYSKYLTQTDPIVGYDADEHFTIKFTEGNLVETFTILSHPIYIKINACKTPSLPITQSWWGVF